MSVYYSDVFTFVEEHPEDHAGLVYRVFQYVDAHDNAWGSVDLLMWLFGQGITLDEVKAGYATYGEGK